MKSIVLFTLLALSGAANAGFVPMLLTPQPAAIEPGRRQVIVVHALNLDSHTAAGLRPGEVLEAELVFDGAVRSVQLKLRESPGAVNVQPRSFITLEYELDAPADVPANAVLRLVNPSFAVSGPILPPAVESAQKAESQPQGAVAPFSEAPRSASAQSPAVASRSASEAGLVEYRPLNFSAYEPIYFLIGNEEPNAKFQISFKYQIVPAESPVGKAAPWATGFHIGYTQLSFWDLSSDSNPFFDNSYKPEIMWLWDNIRPGQWGRTISRVDLQMGAQHESNGQDGADSRSVNIAYIRPVLNFGDRNRWFISVGPRFWTYIADLDDNDDIAEFRGYGDLKIVAGKGDGLQMAAIGRLGSDFDKGSLQVDLSYPIRKVLFDSFDIYLHGQLFTGYGESLIEYDESGTTLRLGISLVR